jgi:hypothetical protein
MWKIELTSQQGAPRRFVVCRALAKNFRSAICRYASSHGLSELAVNARIVANV